MVISGSPILWQNEDSNITLLDIPRSISAAQGTAERPCHDLLTSSEPMQEPYVTVEPKSEKAKQNLQQNTVDENLHTTYSDILSIALESIRQTHLGPWALKRTFITSPGTVRPSKKRKLDSQDAPATGDIEPEEGETRSADTPLQDEVPVTNNSLQLIHQDHDEPHAPEEICQICDPEDPRFRTNCNAVTLKIHQTEQNGHSAQGALRVPPYSAFYIGDCAKTSRAFHNAIRHQANEHETRRHFDFVLLDPPWPNRSVKRTYQTPGAGYAISNYLDDVYDLIMKMDLDMLMAEDCLVGMWITNKQAIRELVLGEDGVFDQWGVELVEEWIWLKTTLHGVPVTPIDSAWRKPYEVLLLGRKRRRGASGEAEDVKRRTIVAVPDFHSRKPCLKNLIEPLMPHQKDYRALEVFARHLVAEWWSWGNECTKFNCESNWHRAEDFEEIYVEKRSVGLLAPTTEDRS